MQDSVAETGEVTHAVTNTFQDFDFVIAAFSIANIEGVENRLVPVVNCSGTLSEFRKMGGFGAADPVGKEFFSHVGIWRMHQEEEIVFKVICLRQPC